MPRNVYLVPERKWRRWGAVARTVFNQVFHDLTGAWELLAPESLQGAPKRGRRMLAWNAAWIAADAVHGET